jgi:hypothetical protein
MVVLRSSSAQRGPRGRLTLSRAPHTAAPPVAITAAPGRAWQGCHHRAIAANDLQERPGLDDSSRAREGGTLNRVPPAVTQCEVPARGVLIQNLIGVHTFRDRHRLGAPLCRCIGSVTVVHPAELSGPLPQRRARSHREPISERDSGYLTTGSIGRQLPLLPLRGGLPAIGRSTLCGPWDPRGRPTSR